MARRIEMDDWPQTIMRVIAEHVTSYNGSKPDVVFICPELSQDGGKTPVYYVHSASLSGECSGMFFFDAGDYVSMPTRTVLIDQLLEIFSIAVHNDKKEVLIYDRGTAKKAGIDPDTYDWDFRFGPGGTRW